MRRLARRLHEFANLIVESDEADTIRLVQHQIRQPSGGHAGVVVLGHRIGTVTHRIANVEQNPANEIRFRFVLLEEEATGAAVHLPIDVLDVVAGNVLAVLGELDREAVIGALVHARQEAFHQQASL